MKNCLSPRNGLFRCYLSEGTGLFLCHPQLDRDTEITNNWHLYQLSEKALIESYIGILTMFLLQY